MYALTIVFYVILWNGMNGIQYSTAQTAEQACTLAQSGSIAIYKVFYSSKGLEIKKVRCPEIKPIEMIEEP